MVWAQENEGFSGGAREGIGAGPGSSGDLSWKVRTVVLRL